MGIKDLRPQVGMFKQGYFSPKRPEKVIGDLSKLIFRSSWELKFMRYCDNHPGVTRWSSEPIPIPYHNSLDGKNHTYNVDFYIRHVDGAGAERDYLIEIKPESQKNPPKKPSGRMTEKRARRYVAEMKVYLTNMAKFDAARQYAEQRGYRFMVITEDFLEGKSTKVFL